MIENLIEGQWNRLLEITQEVYVTGVLECRVDSLCDPLFKSEIEYCRVSDFDILLSFKKKERCYEIKSISDDVSLTFPTPQNHSYTFALLDGGTVLGITPSIKGLRIVYDVVPVERKMKIEAGETYSVKTTKGSVGFYAGYRNEDTWVGHVVNHQGRFMRAETFFNDHLEKHAKPFEKRVNHSVDIWVNGDVKSMPGSSFKDLIIGDCGWSDHETEHCRKCLRIRVSEPVSVDDL